MPLKVWNGSSWQLQAQLKVWNGSSWVALNDVNNAKTARVWNGSSWVQFHPGVQLEESSVGSGISLNDTEYSFSPTSATVGINLFSNGSAQYVAMGVQNYSWLLSGSASDYYAWMDSPSGDAFSTGPVATAWQLSSTTAWSLQVIQSYPGVSYKALTSTLRIKNNVGTDIITVPVDFSVYAEVN